MKIYIYAAIVVAVLAGIWWLSGARVRALEADLKTAATNHKVEVEKLKRTHDETKRRLATKTTGLLAELNAIKSDGCYRLDDNLPAGIGELLNSNHSKTGR